jgi:hypothetical protein
MKPYLDTEDTFYFNYEELIKPSKIITNLAELKAELDPKQKSKRHYAGIGAVIFTFTVVSIVIGLSIYTAWQIAYGQYGQEHSYNEAKAMYNERKITRIIGRISLLSSR